MKSLPATVSAYKRTPVFTDATVPPGLLKDHTTKPGVWGVIHVLFGALRYTIAATGEVVDLSPERRGIVEPAVPHHVTPMGPVAFYVEFCR